MQIQQIPLSQLKPSPSNVRRAGASIDDLAASIEAHGLLQSLVVAADGDEFAVVAGSRRLQALKHNAARAGVDEADVMVACTLAAHEDATELSLAENTIRQAMHPADEFEAYSALARDQGISAAEIAVRFGTTEKHVAQRMRLGNVAPELIAEYRAGKATLDQMMALAIVDDHAAQLKVWKASKNDTWERQPSHLRDALIEREVASNSVLGAFIDPEAYEKAGGKVRRDLFSDFVSFPDAKIVNKVALAKLEEIATKLRTEGWGWVEARLEFPYSEQQKFRQVNGVKPDAKYGAIVTLPRYVGEKVRVELGLLKPGQKATPSKGKAAKKKPQAIGGNAREARMQLVGIRTGAIRAALRSNPRAAIAALAASMAAEVLFGWNARDPISAVLYLEGLGGYQDPAAASGMKLTDPTGPASWEVWEKRLRAGAKGSNLLAYLLQQPEEDVLELLTVLIARGADTDNIDDEGDDFKGMHVVAGLLGVDLAKAWSPTVEWLAKQSKDFILDAVADAKDEAAAKPLEKMKVADMAAAAVPILVAAGWVPEPLRPPAPPKPKAPAKKAAKKAAKK